MDTWKDWLRRLTVIWAGLWLFCPGPLGGWACAASLTVSDALGRNVEVSLPVRTIAALNSDMLEVLRILDAQELVAGVHSEIIREKDFWKDLAQKPKLGSWRDPDMESIAVLKPDLVIAYSRSPGPLLEKKMALFGITVLRLDLYKMESLEREVILLGKVLGRENQADRFCKWHRKHLEMIRERTGGSRTLPSVYIESYSEYHSAGPGSGGHEMCVLAGGRNIAAGFSIPYPRVTPEWVVSENPDMIIKAASWANGYHLESALPFNEKRDALVARPTWEHITAIANKNVHVMDSAIWTGPRAVVGIAYMARWIYPEQFKDFDPRDLHREYMEIFQRVPFRGQYVSDDERKAGK